MRESDLWPPVREWLEKRGYEIYVERFDVDVVAVKDNRLTVVELKLGCTAKLIEQLDVRSRWADIVYAAIPRRPQVIGEFRYRGYGVLLVKDGKCKQILKPKQQPWSREKMRKYRFKVLAKTTPALSHEVAGLPACRELRENRKRSRSQAALEAEKPEYNKEELVAELNRAANEIDSEIESLDKSKKLTRADLDEEFGSLEAEK